MTHGHLKSHPNFHHLDERDRRRQAGADHVDAVERRFGSDRVRLAGEAEAGVGDGEIEVLGHLVLVENGADLMPILEALNVGARIDAMGSSSDNSVTGDLRAGRLVRVRSKEEILSTLDSTGKLEGLPFMPEMLQFCGQEFRVRARAHKVCDTVDWQGFREMDNAVHLEELRCDGSAHGGCDASCLLFWKEAWLASVTSDGASAAATSSAAASQLSEEELGRTTEVGTNEAGQVLYSCQAAEIPKATRGPLRWWNPQQYAQDITSGNSNPRRVARALLVGAFNRFQIANKRLFPKHCLIEGGRRYPFIKGTAASGDTPSDKLDLRPGEIVEIKSKEEIFSTLDEDDKTQGLRFDGEMLKYCGRRARVLRRIEKIIDEKTGRMLRIRRDTVILDGVICTGDYHRSCPRAIFPYWREVWLKRVEEGPTMDRSAAGGG